ncbi:MAG: hypothetical protein ACKONH_07400 [Planctomycetia bacterium]
MARGHAAFIGRLGAGEVRITGEQGTAADAVRSVFVEGGFVEVSHDTVTERQCVSSPVDSGVTITQRIVPEVFGSAIAENSWSGAARVRPSRPSSWPAPRPARSGRRT